MNQQIQQLAEQAIIKTSYQYQTWGDRTATDYKEQFDKEKFAELLIQECAGIADIKRDTSAGCGYVTQTAGQRIKKHFGVDV